MSRRDGCWERSVAARRVLSPFAGLRRARWTRSTPEIRVVSRLGLHGVGAIERRCAHRVQRRWAVTVTHPHRGCHGTRG